MSFRDWIERLILRLDERFRDAHREPEATPAKCPAGCACVRCDATVPDPACEHPASLRYELDRWYCGSCGDPCEPPAVLPGPHPPSPTRRNMSAPVETPLVWSDDPVCVCADIDASDRPCITCQARATVIGRIDD